jgi:hypothetical protein
MTTFIINAENSITAITQQEAAAGIPDGAMPFTSDKELLRLAADWPAERMVEIWNGIPGVQAVTRFTSRKAGAGRIWKAIQGLAAAAETEPAAEPAKPARSKRTKAAAKPTAKPAKKGKAAKKPASAREGSKKAEVLELLRRKGGCTLAEIMKTTDWQAHTVRGFISGTLGKKMGLTVASTKSDTGERTYSVTR